MEFLNTEPEANNEFWLWLDDEEERLYPEDISSPDIQKAVNVFCMDTFQFLRQQFPEYEDKLLLALKQNQSISDLLTLPYDYSECNDMNEITSLISSWVAEVFMYQILDDIYNSIDNSLQVNDETRKILIHPKIYDFPRRLEAMRRLRESWSKIAPHSGIETILRECQLDMTDWDRKSAV